MELNASDTRSKKSLQQEVDALLGNHTLMDYMGKWKRHTLMDYIGKWTLKSNMEAF